VDTSTQPWTYRTDRRLEDDILEALARAALDARGVGVRVINGDAILFGKTVSHYERARLGRVAATVRGIRGVVNDLVVRESLSAPGGSGERR
jgi:osmotically-inducible protein OsmY